MVHLQPAEHWRHQLNPPNASNHRENFQTDTNNSRSLKYAAARALKVDGVLGPKTNDRVRDVLTYQGTAPLLARLNALGAKS